MKKIILCLLVMTFLFGCTGELRGPPMLGEVTKNPISSENTSQNISTDDPKPSTFCCTFYKDLTNNQSFVQVGCNESLANETVIELGGAGGFGEATLENCLSAWHR